MSWQLALMRWQMRYVTKPLMKRVSDPDAARRGLELCARFLFRRPPFLRHYRRPGGLHWISAGPCRPGKVILYFHGGGYIAGSPNTHSGLLARLSKQAGVEVCAPEYHLAPKSAFPAPIDDARRAWDRLMAMGYQPHDIVLGGDSAGGGIALALLSALCQRGTHPAGAVLFSPWTDLTLSGESLSANAKSDPLLPVERIDELVEYYMQGGDRSDPRASPLFATYPDCPPVLIQYALTEILRDDAERMACHLTSLGAQVRLQAEADAPHVWQIFDGWIPEARMSLRQAGGFVQACFDEISRKPSASPM